MSGDLVAGRHGRPRQPLEEIPQEYAAFKIEQRGIDLIPDAERKMRPSGLFWLWSGAVFNVEFFFYGTLIMIFGLTVPQAIAAILVGNLFYALLGFASLQGPKTGTTAFMVSRAPFGQNGNRMVALFNWFTQVGFEIEGIFFVVATVILLFSLHGTNLNGPAKIVVIILAALLQMVMPLLGHPTISKLLRWLAYVFIVFFAVLAGFTFNRLHLSTFHPKPVSFAVWTTALVLLISVGGLGWTENGNDYSRYLPRNTPGSKTFWSATLGGAIPSIILEILGVFAFTITTKTRRHRPDRRAAVVPELVRDPVLDLRHLPAAVDQHHRHVLLRCHAAGAGRAGPAVGRGHHRHRGVRGGHRHHLVPRELLARLRRVPAVHRGVAGPVVRHLDDRLRAARPLSMTRCRCGPRGTGCTGATAASTGRPSSPRWSAWSPRCCGSTPPSPYPSYTGPISNHFPGLAGGDFSWAIGIVVGALVYWALASRGVRREAAQTARA